MATSIATTAAFTASNMKPTAGEQIDSLWGQNIADNTGYVMYRRMLACTFAGIGIGQSLSAVGTDYGTAWFQKRAEHSYLIGSYVGTTNASGHLQAWVNGTSIFTHNGAGSNWTSGTIVDISGLTTGSWYPISVMVAHDAAGIAQLKGMSLWLSVDNA